MRSSFEKLITEVMSAAKPPICIVSDYFLSWTRGVAEQFHFRWYAFHPSSASYLALQFYTPTILSKYRRLSSSHYDDAGAVTHFVDSDGPICVPGIGCLEVDDIPHFLRNNFPLASHNAVANSASNLHEAAGVLVNTYGELEKSAHQALCSHLKLNPNMVEIFPVGPYLSIAETSDDGSTLNPEVQKAINWLNDQEASSVLYICFGSLFKPSLRQIQELAFGLEASGYPFFWVVRSPASTESEGYDLSQILPPHFLSRTRKQGKVFTGWAPQLRILSHSSVGGFLSHCGWNSITESIVMGIPILAFPQGADQMINARLLSEELKVALVLGKGDKGLVERCQIERAVRNLMEDHENRKRARELQIAARRAIAEGGSSQKSLEEFIQSATTPYPSQ
ncbi:hypothetical protein O6H91_19G045000 [Diphasiastrum complanatum]|nr:hypothetical protein O6H91_19G045000 [Diphasiastrum complanatum]